VSFAKTIVVSRNANNNSVSRIQVAHLYPEDETCMFLRNVSDQL